MKFLKYLVLNLLVVFAFSCKDEWNDHIRLNMDVSDKTIVQILENNPQLSEFLLYLEKSGLDKELSSSKLFTLWVPDNDAMASVDPSILNDSVKLRLFVSNHFSTSEYTIQGTKRDTSVKVYSAKNLVFNNMDSTIDGFKIKEGDIFAKNGVLHIVSHILNPRLNIWEYIETMAPENEHVTYLKSLSGERFVPNPKYQLGFDPVTGKPVYDIEKCMVWYNYFLENVADLRMEDSVYTVFIVDDNTYNNEYDKFKKYFCVENGTTSADTAKVKYKITKDYVFRGAYKNPGLPDTLKSLENVKVPFKGSATLLYRASNGYVYLVNDCSIGLHDKIPTVIVEGETSDKYLLPTINIAGSNKRYNPLASGGYDFILDNHGQAAAEYADGTNNPNAGGIALHVKELASVKYRILWKAVNNFRGGLRNPNDTLTLKQKLAFSQILSFKGTQPVWEQAAIITTSYVAITDRSYSNAQEVELSKWTFSKMREDIYFQILCGGANMSVTLDYLKLEPIFE
jgi:uncharacterized surface protein with fasciclin (FAS1) repeats